MPAPSARLGRLAELNPRRDDADDRHRERVEPADRRRQPLQDVEPQQRRDRHSADGVVGQRADEVSAPDDRPLVGQPCDDDERHHAEDHLPRRHRQKVVATFDGYLLEDDDADRPRDTGAEREQAARHVRRRRPRARGRARGRSRINPAAGHCQPRRRSGRNGQPKTMTQNGIV